MKKLMLGATAALVLLLVLPVLGTAVLVSAAAAAAEQAGPCTSVATPATGAWRPPLQQAYTLTSRFGPRTDPITGASKNHTGVDLVALPGSGPVVAAAAGTLTVGADPDGYGAYLTIEHGGGISTLYGHLAALAPGIATGTTVWLGQQLGVEGSSGHATGTHLHYEVRQDGAPIDPGPFMLEHGAPLDGTAIAPSSPPDTTPSDPGRQQGGVGFALPEPGTPRLNSVSNPPLPIPEQIKDDYLAAAERYHLPWSVLAGIGMQESGHGRATATSSAGAQGLMQFLPATWASYGVDGSGDGRADIHNDADSAMSAANYLTASGLTSGGTEGVRRALFAYNHADWYVNDVLSYAQAYGGGIIPGDPSDCGPTGAGDPTLPDVNSAHISDLLAWAHSHIGDPYLFGANGPHAWDCSSFVKAAYARAGITLPRTANAQRDWLAHGNGYRVPPGAEQPGDLLFVDSYLGPNQIGHVMIVEDPARKLTIEAGGSHVDTYPYSHWQTHRIYELWRIGTTQ